MLVDNVQATLAAYHAAVFIAFFRGFERAENFHKSPVSVKRGRFLASAPWVVNGENTLLFSLFGGEDATDTMVGFIPIMGGDDKLAKGAGGGDGV